VLLEARSRIWIDKVGLPGGGLRMQSGLVRTRDDILNPVCAAGSLTGIGVDEKVQGKGVPATRSRQQKKEEK